MTRPLPLLVLLAALALTGLAGCAEAPPPALSETSLYLVEVDWTTDADAPTRLADFQGRPVALAMVYASCGTACPTIVRDMQALGEAADADDLAYVLVSLDPERDSPAHLRMFRDAHGLGDEWTLLTGDPDDVQTLAAVLGVRYRPEPDGTIAHSNLITLLDRGGDVAAQLTGLGADPAPALADFHRALGSDS
ncbi:SCO family protein [Rubrivirga sp. IMCC43871]|uniref:SCO family protein n=1 Tax=Rubrivirga sp. IMCC43871 TaxID=3391575 RepID=UPI00398FED3D